MDKKTAKSEMLKELSKEMSDDQYSPLKDLMKGKKMEKVSVMSDSPQGLKKGLSKAQELLKLKGYDSEEKGDEESEKECEGESCEGCPGCESEEGESEMSPEQIRELIKSLQAKLGE